jgi:NAD(P)-dependent dehydrogenase (short-subunit alcohol dehydrogenase family)
VSAAETTSAGSVVITGASTGIGAACALALDKLNFRVFAGVRKRADGEALQAQASARLRPFQLDVTSADDIAAALNFLVGEVGDTGLTGLVNNAGIGVVGPLEIVSLDQLRRQFEVNVIGLIAVTQALLPLLRKARGRVVNMSSIAGRAAMPYMGPYAASKHALEALSDALRIELQQTGVRVSVIQPGAIATPIWHKTRKEVNGWESTWSEESKALYLDGLNRVKHIAAMSEENAAPPSLVADAVIHALTAPNPKPRYLVGRDAKLRALLTAFLPDSLQDKLLTRVLKLPHKQ